MDINKNKIRITVSDLRKNGYLHGTGSAGILCWKKGDDVISSMKAESSISGTSGFISFSYTHCGRETECTVQLRRYGSNLPSCTGCHYYFICPVTGNRCRNLYFSDGSFMGRKAFGSGAMYAQQELSRRQREFPTKELKAYLDMALLLERQPDRRETYNGKATPFCRKLGKLMNKALPAFHLNERERDELKQALSVMLKSG